MTDEQTLRKIKSLLDVAGTPLWSDCRKAVRLIDGLLAAHVQMKTIIYEDGTDHVYDCANGFVSRCVAAVHAENFADARRVMEILNAHFAAKNEVVQS